METLTSLIPFILIMVLFWVLMIVPQQKAAKKRQAMLDGLKAGDKIETVGRIFGEIVRIDGDQLVVDIAKGHRNLEIVIHKEGVARVVNEITSERDGSKSDSSKSDSESDNAKMEEKWSKSK